MHDSDFADGVLDVIRAIKDSLDHLERAVRQQAALPPEPAEIVKLEPIKGGRS
jgi:hypothetical protein